MPNSPELEALVGRAHGIHERLVSDIPQLKRGMVWCTTCGRSQSVKGTDGLRHGWPECCGYTMTIDSPEERRALSERQQDKEG